MTFWTKRRKSQVIISSVLSVMGKDTGRSGHNQQTNTCLYSGCHQQKFSFLKDGVSFEAEEGLLGKGEIRLTKRGKNLCKQAC